MVSTKSFTVQFTMILGYGEILGNFKYFLFLAYYYIHLMAKMESVLI